MGDHYLSRECDACTNAHMMITSVGSSGIPPPLMISSSTIAFSKYPNISPLISRITINPVSSGLNGTVVNCFEGSLSTESVATISIYIMGGE